MAKFKAISTENAWKTNSHEKNWMTDGGKVTTDSP